MTHAIATLAYGYDLGGFDDGLRFAEAARDASDEDVHVITIPWLVTESPDAELTHVQDLVDIFELRLLRVLADHDFTAQAAAANAIASVVARTRARTQLFAEHHAALQSLDVDLVTYGYEDGESLMLVIRASVHHVEASDAPTFLDAHALNRNPAHREYDDKLLRALAALDITPTQRSASWLLVASG